MLLSGSELIYQNGLDFLPLTSMATVFPTKPKISPAEIEIIVL